MARPRKQTGPIHDPVVVNTFEGTADRPAFLIEIVETYLAGASRKLSLVMDRYGITDKSDYFTLALFLAIDHEPGFEMKEHEFRKAHGDYGAIVPADTSKDGRAVHWTPERLLKLVSDVEAQTATGITNREAFSRLARQDATWKAPKTHRGTNAQWAETLEARYHDGRKLKQKIATDEEQVRHLLSRLLDHEARSKWDEYP